MKIRLISDLHIDINAEYSLDFKSEGLEDMFTVVAGDICGSPLKAAEWIKYNISKGAFISGNHDVYDTDMPIEDVKRFFASKFPMTSDVTYFDYDVGVMSKMIDTNVLLVADVMYTDYKFNAGFRNPTGDVRRNMQIADPWRNMHSGMNDFNYGRCNKTWYGVNDAFSRKRNRLVPEYYLEHHEAAFKAVTDIIEQNKCRDIILVTHHCLSPKCIDDEHEDCDVIASYVSDKEDWIKAHPNLKCICSGHIHARKSFKVGETLYVMNSLGYCDRHFKQWSEESKSYVFWTPDCIIDTETWTVDFKSHDMPAWSSKYDKETEKIKKILPFLM